MNEPSIQTAKRHNHFLSVIIPVYNESKRLVNIVEIVSFFRKLKFKSEIIVVNDGSSDDTLKKLKTMQKKYKFSLLSYGNNQGKGFAIKSGMVSAKGKYHLFFDIDLSTPLKEVYNFLPLLPEYDLIIATRKLNRNKLLIRQPKIRELLGKAFTNLSKVTLQTNVSDFTCGFKIFSRESSKIIFPRLRINRWGFDSEILFLAKKKNLQVKEIPVNWKNDPLTKVKFPQDIFNSLKELLLIRWYNFKGHYD